MAASSVMVSLPQMVDLALNCPEIGAVNFNILHTVLHVIIQQLDLLDCKIELHGDRSDKMQQLIATQPGPTINLTEFVVTPGKDQRRILTKVSKLKRIRKKGDAAGSKKPSKEEIFVEKELKVIEPRKDSKEEPVKNPTPLTSATHLIESPDGSMHTVIVVEPTDGTEGPYTTVSLAKSEIEKIKSEIKELKELPGNMGLIDALRNAAIDKSSPVVDMFQILTLSKRIDATETAVGKLASMLEDLAKERSTPFTTVGSGGGLEGARTGSVVAHAIPGVSIAPAAFGAPPVIPGDLTERLDDLDKRVRTLEESGTRDPGEKVVTARGDAEATPEERLNELEAKLAEYTNQTAEHDNAFSNEITVLQAQFVELEKEMGEVIERINAGLPGGDIGADKNIAELYENIIRMKQEMEAVAKNATKILEDKEDRQLTLDAIVEQIELLKTVKADREDLEDALADKADACLVNRKVSHDQFDAACDDLSRGIEEALCKLTQQEQLWQQALDDIQHEIENKLDKMELTPLRNFIHNKLKSLQERLKSLAALKKETEAAGTKSKYLRNVQCISCDKDVVMRKQMDPSLMPPPASLPPTKSMGPYLAYELDNLRRQQKCTPHGRNMNHFENAMAGAKSKDQDHLCNRYCGGSHTVTTPQQRVSRLGHFLQQWGPEMQADPEGQVRGTDGQLYKSREGDAFGRASLQVEESQQYVPSSKARPSMVVQGSILAKRGNLKGEEAKIEEEAPTAAPPPTTEAPPEEKRPSATPRRASSGLQRPSATARSSTASARRASRASTAGTQKPAPPTGSGLAIVKQSGSRMQSKISFKSPEAEAIGGDEAAAEAAADAPTEPEEAKDNATGDVASGEAPGNEAAPVAEAEAPQDAEVTQEAEVAQEADAVQEAEAPDAPPEE